MENFSNINLDYYKIFYYVAKEQNLTRAAEKLFISQPAVTQTINKLEDMLGEKLFYRQSKGIVLTKIGEKIFKQVEKGLFFFNKISSAVSNEKNLIEGTIKIGAGTNIARDVLPEPVCSFLQDYPNIKFDIIDEHKKVLLDQLLNGDVDIAIVQKKEIDNDKFEIKSMVCDKFVFFCHKDYVKNKKMSPEEFKKLEFIMPIETMTTREVINEVFERYNFQPNIRFQVAGQNMTTKLVMKKLGVGILPYKRVREKVENNIFQIIETDIELPSLEYCCVTLKEYILPAAKAFLPYLLSNQL